MQLKTEQLAGHLKKSLLPAYLVAGDEPFQVGECCDRIRARAREQGFLERQLFSADTGLDWSAVYSEAQSPGLFGDRRVLEIRLDAKRPDKAGSQVLQELLAAPADDTLLLVVCSRLDRRKDLNSKWVKALEKCGAVLQVWPVDPRALPDWIARRLSTHELRIDRPAAELLAERSEGNLLACAQEVDKLALLYPEGEISVEQVQQAVGDSSRFGPFDLTEAIGRGDVTRALRVLDTLRAEGTEPPVLLWALAREIRAMAALASGSDPGIRMPPQHLRLLEQRARQLGRDSLDRALALAARADQSVKGMAPGDPWEVLASLVMRLAGRPLPETLES